MFWINRQSNSSSSFSSIWYWTTQKTLWCEYKLQFGHKAVISIFIDIYDEDFCKYTETTTGKFTKKYLCQRLFLNKKETLAPAFPVNFSKFLRTHLLQNTFGRVLLNLVNAFFAKISVDIWQAPENAFDADVALNNEKKQNGNNIRRYSTKTRLKISQNPMENNRATAAF